MKDRIKKIRKELNLTQQGFADRLGMSRDNIGGYETGRRNPSDAVISLICKTDLKGKLVNEEWLRTGNGEMFAKTPNSTLEKLKQEYNLDDFSYGLICEYLKLDERKRDVVRQYFHDVLSYDETGMPEKEEMDIDAMVEDYRQQLILEKKAMEKSEALRKNA